MPTDGIRERLGRLHAAALADVLDGLGWRDQAMTHEIAPLYPGARLAGRAFTAQAAPCHRLSERPYALQIEALDRLEAGSVMVVAGAGCGAAFWGELLSTRARVRGCVGAVVDGLARDSERILAMGFPAFARGRSPRDSYGRVEVVAYGVPVLCGGVWVRPGDYLLGDADGVVVVPAELAARAVALAEEKVGAEGRVRTDLEAGASAGEAFARHRVL